MIYCPKTKELAAIVCSLILVKMSGDDVSTSASHVIGDVLQDVVIRIDSGQVVGDEELHRINRMVAPLTNETERAQLRAVFENRLFSISVANRDFRCQEILIREVWLLARRIWGSPPGGTAKEWWALNLRALAWVRSQVSYIENSEPEDKRTWPQKWGNVEVAANGEHKKWNESRSRIAMAYQGFIRRCAQDIEDDRYTEEFRTWCKENIEKIIGRRLTDDDLIFRDDVLKRREKRK